MGTTTKEVRVPVYVWAILLLVLPQLFGRLLPAEPCPGFTSEDMPRSLLAASKPLSWITHRGSASYQIVTHQLERPAHIAYQSANLSFHGLLTSPSFNRFIKMHCFLKPDDYGTLILPENLI
ncbi:hypothetical protein CHARACLAT_013278 [Characodon lateralis]|uniref:Uncharacterized protein n=1 Tax=Characodon lateralis TaxID=208331 RepID=A0ABU7DQP7_9TELE|nr:hypothetical protein [Characodon lateralis]